MATDLGIRLRRLRKQKELSLERLAAKSGVALATLSRIENGKGTGTFRTHRRIADAFGLSLAELYRDLQPQEQDAHQVKSSGDEAESFRYDEKASAIVLAKQVSGKQMLPQMIFLRSGGGTVEEQYPLGTERWLFGLEGSFSARVGDSTYQVSPGETLYFKASLPHQLRNEGTAPAKLISVTSPATF